MLEFSNIVFPNKEYLNSSAITLQISEIECQQINVIDELDKKVLHSGL